MSRGTFPTNLRVPREDSNQPAHPRSLSLHRVQCSTQGFSCSQRLLWSDCADAQAHLSIHWAHMQSCTNCCVPAHMTAKWDVACEMFSSARPFDIVEYMYINIKHHEQTAWILRDKCNIGVSLSHMTRRHPLAQQASMVVRQNCQG